MPRSAAMVVSCAVMLTWPTAESLPVFTLQRSTPQEPLLSSSSSSSDSGPSRPRQLVRRNATQTSQRPETFMLPPGGGDNDDVRRDITISEGSASASDSGRNGERLPLPALRFVQQLTNAFDGRAPIGAGGRAGARIEPVEDRVHRE